MPPAVVVRDKLVTERKGEDVTLRCAARGNPNPRITWTKKVGDTVLQLIQGPKLGLM